MKGMQVNLKLKASLTSACRLSDTQHRYSVWHKDRVYEGWVRIEPKSDSPLDECNPHPAFVYDWLNHQCQFATWTSGRRPMHYRRVFIAYVMDQIAKELDRAKAKKSRR